MQISTVAPLRGGEIQMTGKMDSAGTFFLGKMEGSGLLFVLYGKVST